MHNSHIYTPTRLRRSPAKIEQKEASVLQEIYLMFVCGYTIPTELTHTHTHTQANAANLKLTRVRLSLAHVRQRERLVQSASSVCAQNSSIIRAPQHAMCRAVAIAPHLIVANVCACSDGASEEPHHK